MITSTHNARLRELRKLHDRKHRERSGLFVAEGEDMLHEALRFGWAPHAVFYDAGALASLDALLGRLDARTERIVVERAALASAGSLGSGSRLIGVFEQRWSRLVGGDAGAAIYLDGIADLGNIGAVIRSALAFGPSLMVLSEHSADPFGPKAVRASMGAVFGQPIVRAPFGELSAALGWRSVALVPGVGRPLREVASGERTLFVLGSERRGLDDRIASVCDEIAHVPQSAGGSESLNVAMVATLCLYENFLHRLPKTTTASDD